MNYPSSIADIKTGRSSLTHWISTNYPDFFDYLSNNYLWTNDMKEKIYCFYNSINEQNTCYNCHRPTKFHGYTYGYAKFCCPSCAQLDTEVRQKQSDSCVAKYGDNYTQEFILRGQLTKQKKYGDAKYNNTSKMKQTMIERYGVDNPQKSDIFKEKSKQTCLKKYGVEYALQRPEFLEEAHKRQLNLIKINHPDIISKNGDMLTCKCPDDQCTLCKEKCYNILYNTFYQRKYVYDICPCIKKVPLNSSVQNNKNTNIEAFVRSVLDEYHIEYRANVRDVIFPLELDIYIPNHNIAIECNGVYWHDSNHVENNYHHKKFQKCIEKNIQLLSIWEDQMYNSPDIIKSIILSKFGIYGKRIYARKCEIKNVSNIDAKQFLNDNHLQGFVNSKIQLGLYYEDELVSIMTFGRGRKILKSNEEWELYRYCNKQNIQIIGGASKLFDYFINTYNPKTIISFSSNDISNGNLYVQLGFDKIRESISYWYIIDHKRYHRCSFSKHKLVKMGYDESKTEKEITQENNFLRIYDSGQILWRYTNKIWS